MSRLDIVIFGATGFTGRKAVAEIARVAMKEKITWAVAGRSEKKLRDVLAEAGKTVGENLSNIKIIIADTSDSESVKAMCAQGKVVANCCGPYRHYGEPVIKACIDTKTHHVDVSGEPQFIESMQLKYNEAARNAGVLVISACGFDSIPNDMGVVFLQQNFGGTLNSVESYLSSHLPSEYAWAAMLGGSFNYGTWESLVHSLANWHELKPLRKQLYPEKLPEFKPKLPHRPVIHRFGNMYAVPFPGADNSIVYRTQRSLHDNSMSRPAHFRAYMRFSSLCTTVLVLASALSLMVLTRLKCTVKLLLAYPRLFSMGMATRGGPPEEVMNNTTFEFHLVGQGWADGTDTTAKPDKQVVVKVRGVNPGYGATVTALIWSAVTLLRERDRMPAGGVLTTGMAFANTNLIKKLNENNLTFEVVKSEAI